MRRLGLGALWLLALLGALAWQAPATLLDLALRQGGGALRLADARGSVWRGGGVLLVEPAGGRAALPLGALGWRLAGFDGGALGVALDFDGRPLGRLGFGAGGVDGALADLQVAAGTALSALPGALGRADWEGRLALTSAALRCDWRGRCDGKAQLAWYGAATRRLEAGALGDYLLALDVRGDRVDFELSSAAGPVLLAGKGNATGGAVSFDGTARGNDAVLAQFPLFLGPLFEATGAPGEYKIKVRDHLLQP